MTPFWMQPSRASTKRPTPELGAVLPHSTSNHLTRIWRNACGIRAWSRSMAGAKQFAMQPESAKSLALIRRSSPTCSRSWAIGAKTAAQLLNRHGAIESFPPHVLGDRCDLALLFKKLATLRTDARLFNDVKTLHWRGATPAFAAWAVADGGAAANRTMRKGCDPLKPGLAPGAGAWSRCIR
jgi:hypothetical protein